MPPKFFPKASDFHKWLKANHNKKTELLVGFHKVKSGSPSMSWPESVDEALCYGWIDGVRKSIDENSYTIRFTPRRPGSIWSAINIRKVGELVKQGRMQAPGLEIFENRDKKKAMIYSHENAPKELTAAYEKQFRTDKKAWAFFQAQAPSYRKVIIHWIMSAKQEKTQLSRLEKAIDASGKEKKL